MRILAVVAVLALVACGPSERAKEAHKILKSAKYSQISAQGERAAVLLGRSGASRERASHLEQDARHAISAWNAFCEANPENLKACIEAEQLEKKEHP